MTPTMEMRKGRKEIIKNNNHNNNNNNFVAKNDANNNLRDTDDAPQLKKNNNNNNNNDDDHTSRTTAIWSSWWLWGPTNDYSCSCCWSSSSWSSSRNLMWVNGKMPSWPPTVPSHCPVGCVAVTHISSPTLCQSTNQKLVYCLCYYYCLS